jgi:hypothetical protein
MNVIEAAGLGRRFWKTWAVRHCTLAIPAGRVAALTGTGSAWLTRLHDTFWIAYQPGSRYWLFQLILAGGTLLAALLLAAATIALIRHRRA